MYRQLAGLSLLALTLLAAPAVEAQWTLDPEQDAQEFRSEAAVKPDGSALLTWTRQFEPGSDYSVVAATLNPSTGQIGEIHELGPGGDEQLVSLGEGAGYLSARLDYYSFPGFTMVAQHLDASGRATGAPVALGYAFTITSFPVAGGGAILVTGHSEDDAFTQVWKFGPDGALLAGPVSLAAPSNHVAAGTDAAGNLVLAWTEQLSPRLFCQRFSSDLQPLGPVVPVALGGAGSVRVAVAPDGRFLVVYQQSGQMIVRPFRADGNPVGGRRLISPRLEYAYDENDWDVAMGRDGRILVVWKTYVNSNIPTLRAQTLSITGTPIGKLVRLEQLRSSNRGNLLRPRLEALPEGDFLVVWTRVDPTEQKTVLQGRRFR